MAEVYCGSEPCPLFLNSTCVFYTGESLLYIGVQNNDTLETIIVKINQAFQNAGVGYAFTNGLIQPTPFQPVQLGGALIQNTTIGGNFTLSFSGNVQAARHITTGGSSSQFVKGDGTLDSTAYQPAANYITGLSGDATASGPGVAVMTLNTVNFSSGTFGNGNTIPIVTVNAKGLVTNITPVPITLPPLPLTFIGDVVGSGFTGSSITLLMQNVNANPYNTITPLKFSVNGKGLVTGASPITASDIVNILGYYPGTSGTSGSDGTSGTSGTTGTSGTSGTSATSGTSGTTGTSGTSATSGTSGTSGTDGTGGTSGTSGSTGTSGTAGTSGTSATSGTSGTTGSSGTSGTSGSTGTSGSSGTTGTSGSSGTTGTSGSSGTSGTTGVDGTSGTSGTTGLDGTNGTSGTSGTAGSSGSSGTSGTTGTSGSSGTSGTTGTSGTSGLSGDRFKTTSTTTYTLQAPGNPGTLTVDTGLAYSVAQSIIIAYDANNHNEAEITSYNALTGVLNFVTFTLTGSGTYSSWSINVDGASGGDGSSGSSGTSGTSATAGTSGTTGSSGSSGTSGTSATSGTSGSSGTTGVDGTSGSSGTSGTTGTSGSSGTSGTTGTSGSSGTSGTSATNGTGGTSGTSGSSGTSGTTGTSGTSATSGTSGTSATSGTTGTSGTSGTNGTGGTSGTSGSSATSGTSGTSGTSVAVSGTTNTMAKFTSATTIGNSALTDNGSTLAYSGSSILLNNSVNIQTFNTRNLIVKATGAGDAGILGRGSGDQFAFQVYGSGGDYGFLNGAWAAWDIRKTANGSLFLNDQTTWYISTSEVYMNRVYGITDMRSPIYYDQNDTGYFGDFNGISSLWGIAIRGDNGPTSTTNQIFFWGGGNTTTSAIGFKNNGGNFPNPTGSGDGYNTYLTMDTPGRGWVFREGVGGTNFGAAYTSGWILNNGIWQANNQMRAPIYFDSNNTGYYVDPSSTTSLRTVGSWRADSAAWDGEFNGKIQYHSNHWYFQSGDLWIFRNAAGTNVVSINQSGVITGSLNGNATYSLNSTRLYATDNPYCYGCAAPYYMYMTYDGTRWFLQVTPATPSAVRVSYSDLSGNTNSISNATGGAYTWTATNYFQSNLGGYSGSLSSPPLQAYATGGNSAFMSFHRGGNYAVNMGLDADNVLRIGGWSASANRWQLDMSGNVYVAGSSRAPIFYDIDNTTYYLDLTSTTSGVIRGNFIFNDYGAGIVGSYSSFRYQAVFAMGDAYKLPIDGTSPSNLYGITWSHPNAGGVASNLNTHGALILENGTFLAALSGSIRARDDMRAPIFYDSNDTSYYANPNGQSNLYFVNAPTGYVSNGNPWGTANSAYFPNGISTAGGTNWIYGTQTYIGNAPSNGAGHEFSSSGTMRSTSSHRATIYYDDNNTGYYCDPNSSTQLRTVYADDWFRPQGCTGVYWQSYGRGMWSPECEGNSYGNITTYGTGRNGWQGWGIGSRHVFMSTGGDNVGVHDNSRGWIWYWNGSFTSFDFGYTQFAGSARAPIFYDSNNTGYYLDPSGGSYFAGSLEIANGYFLSNGVGGAMYMTTVSGSFGGYLRTSGHMVLDQINAGYNVYVLDGNSVGVVKNAGTQSWSAFSDKTIKNIHSVMENNLSKLDGINPIYYSFNNFDDDRNRIGLIAQEVQEHFPELVDLEPRTEKLTLDYTGLIPVLLGAIKELKNKVETLETRI